MSIFQLLLADRVFIGSKQDICVYSEGVLDCISGIYQYDSSPLSETLDEHFGLEDETLCQFSEIIKTLCNIFGICKTSVIIFYKQQDEAAAFNIDSTIYFGFQFYKLWRKFRFCIISNFMYSNVSHFAFFKGHDLKQEYETSKATMFWCVICSQNLGSL